LGGSEDDDTQTKDTKPPTTIVATQKKRAGDFKIVNKVEQNTTPGYRLARKEEAEQVVDDLQIPFNYILSLELPYKIGGPRSNIKRNWFAADSTGDEGHALLVRIRHEDTKPPTSIVAAQKKHAGSST